MNDWLLTYDHWDPKEEALRETLCTLGNGYFATRGAAEESSAEGPHYPGTYLAGAYNRLKTEIKERSIENEDLVNWPNWLCLNFRPDGGDWLSLDQVKILDFYQELNMRSGTLLRRLHFCDSQGRISTLLSRRLVSMDNPHFAALEWTLTPHNWNGKIEIQSTLDGHIENKGVERYRKLNSVHLEILESGNIEQDGIYLVVQSNQSHIRTAFAARTQLFIGGNLISTQRSIQQENKKITESLFVESNQGSPIRIEKVVTVYSSRDKAISEPLLEAKKNLQRSPGFVALLKSHEQAWSRLWTRCNIALNDKTEGRAQQILHLHIFHLLQTASTHSISLDVGVPARGWHGEAYRGHIFWDELFIFPLLNLHLPEITRSLMMYRYHRLNEARHAAVEADKRGAMFPWQSGSNGREESQIMHLNPQSGHWVADHTHRQRHVNSAIVYNLWQYYQSTHDIEFMSFYGAEIILEIARFWASMAQYNPERQRYEIHGIVGPDEFHTQYPHTDLLGIHNNAYTNIMAVWVIDRALQVLNILGEHEREELLEKLEISSSEFERWHEIRRKMFVPFHSAKGKTIISQFEGYEKLLEIDWDAYQQKYNDIHRLDRILEAEGDNINRYQAGKQADVLMLFYLFSSDQLQRLFEQLGYEFKDEFINDNIDYYLQRTSHGSTLSRVVHAWVLARSDRKRSWDLFQAVLTSDISDIQDGTTPEGIHLGAMAGSVDLIERCYTGIEIRDEALYFSPNLPEELEGIALRFRYRGHWLRVSLRQEELVIYCEKSWHQAIKIGFRGKTYELAQDETKVFSLIDETS